MLFNYCCIRRRMQNTVNYFYTCWRLFSWTNIRKHSISWRRSAMAISRQRNESNQQNFSPIKLNPHSLHIPGYFLNITHGDSGSSTPSSNGRVSTEQACSSAILVALIAFTYWVRVIYENVFKLEWKMSLQIQVSFNYFSPVSIICPNLYRLFLPIIWEEQKTRVFISTLFL